ncbi:MAG: hypothetical protein LBK63_10300 [Treponema sp.]|nr:hypothetical protein [Treponema sp.]
MFSDELTSLIVRVVTSWQVIAVTLGIVVYIAIVSNVARLYRSARPKPPKAKKPGKEKKTKTVAEDEDMDELGLGD